MEPGQLWRLETLLWSGTPLSVLLGGVMVENHSYSWAPVAPITVMGYLYSVKMRHCDWLNKELTGQ